MTRVIRSAAKSTDTEVSSILAAHKGQQARPKNGFGAKLLRACRMDEAGATAVEFAFIMPILLLMFSAIVQFGGVFFLENHMSHVARDATRKIVVGELAEADAASEVQQSLLNWGVTYDVSVATVDQDITVAISLPMSEAALMDALGLFQTGNLTATVTMRQES
jgi:Flp pilus assembly protein TadG